MEDVANAIGQIFLLDAILQTHDPLYGINMVLKLINGTEWQQSGFFPRSTLRFRDKNNIILVTHGTTMDAIARSLLGQQPAPMSAEQMNALGTMFPFCSVAVFEESDDGKWKMIDDAMPYITYLDFSNCPSVPYAGQ